MPEDASKEPILGVPSAPPTAAASTYLEVAASETYWGQLLTLTKAPLPIFFRLIVAVFAHFAA